MSFKKIDRELYYDELRSEMVVIFLIFLENDLTLLRISIHRILNEV